MAGPAIISSSKPRFSGSYGSASQVPSIVLICLNPLLIGNDDDVHKMSKSGWAVWLRVGVAARSGKGASLKPVGHLLFLQRYDPKYTIEVFWARGL